MKLSVLLAGAVIAYGAINVGDAKASVLHSKRQAEENLLHAPRALGKLDKHFVDPRTHSLLNNTKASCVGRGRRRGSAWPRFVCTISHGKTSVSVLYFAQRRNGFEIRRLHNGR